MRRTVVGVIAVVTASSVFSLIGLGVAGAVSLDPNSPPSASASVSPLTEAATFKALHDQLQSAWKAKDGAGLQAASGELATQLAALRAQQQGGHQAASASQVNLVDQTQQQNDQLAAALARLPRGKSGADLGLPVGGGLLSAVTDLLSSLLTSILALVTSLLGGLPGLPGVPGLPISPPALPVAPPAVPAPAPPTGH